jgi:hypothetical protein
MEFDSRKVRLMKELWKLSEEVLDAGNRHDATMLEAAGNIVENSFCVGDPTDLALSAIADALSRA